MSLTYMLVFFPPASDHTGQEEDKDIHDLKKQTTICLALLGLMLHLI